jgi:hypothetical protein
MANMPGGGADLSGSMNNNPGPACMGAATDGQPCGTGCGAGSICAGYTMAALGCYQVCNPAMPTCSCGRRCTSIIQPGGGTANVCLPANGPGEKCGNDAAGMPYGTGNCQQGLSCVGSSAGTRYCVGPCTTSQDCPAQTTCEAVVAGMMVSGNVCWYNSQPTGKALGSACTLTDICITDSLCDGTCKPRCTGPGAQCATGTCTQLVDANQQLIGYVCK